MILKEKIKEEPGLQYIVDELNIMSAVGRRQLLEQESMHQAEAIEAELNRIETIVRVLGDPTKKRAVSDLRHQHMQLHDIATTIRNLEHHFVLEEVEMFEIKQLANLCSITRRVAAELYIGELLGIPDLSAVFQLLDPDHTGVPNFYIYDSYDSRLTPLRRELKSLNPSDEAAGQRIGELYAQQEGIQQEVLLRLSDQLFPYVGLIGKALQQMAYSDILFAKAMQVIEQALCRPQVGQVQGSTRYKQLFNPRLLQRNKELKLRYQPVDIEIRPGTCLITGANMAGKTVLLKTIATAQLMVQFGMFVPAEEASIGLVDDVLLCIGDEQNEMNGLSSFASEIIKISNTVQRSQKERLLILIDEPARTTNPIEGKAIVQSISDILNGRDSFTLITTHYSHLGLDCRRLRVRGFDETLSQLPLSDKTINQFMDYSLMEEQDEQVPQEALRIATILGCDAEMIMHAKKYLEETSKNTTHER